MSSLTFEQWQAQMPATLPGWARERAFRGLPDEDQEACFQALADKCARVLDHELHGPELEKPRPLGARPRATGTVTAAGDRLSGAASDDPLLDIAPAEFVEVLTGLELPASGVIRCPLPDHEDRTPSFKAYRDPEDGWCCFGCCRGGSIYDFAGALWGYPPPLRGARFSAVRDRLLEILTTRAAA
jgi:hypothetical protein